MDKELKPLPELQYQALSLGVNWEQRRYEIAKAIMAHEASNSCYSEEGAKYAVACANALVKELQNNPI